MAGYSLNNVLPALLPETSYDGMGVAEGNAAGIAWEEMLHSEVRSEVRKRLRNALAAYCKQETLAMVRLIDVLRAR